MKQMLIAEEVRCNPSWSSVVRIHLACLRMDGLNSDTYKMAEEEILRCANLLDKMLLEHTDYFDFVDTTDRQYDLFEGVIQ